MGFLYWALPVLAVFLFNVRLHDYLNNMALLDTDKVLGEHQWWRLVTSTFLHSDIGHFAANLSIGIPLMGMAMARYGIGWTLQGTLFAGVIGNLFTLGIHPTDYRSLGASGVVMGILGLLTVYLFPLLGNGTLQKRIAMSALAGGSLIFVLTGLSPEPNVNIGAHLGGFLGGVLAGCMLNYLPQRWISSQLANVILTDVWMLIVCFCWFFALDK